MLGQRQLLQQARSATIRHEACGRRPDDPFLTESCHPYEVAEASAHLHAEISPQGGHVGFIRFDEKGCHYYQTRVRAFFRDHWSTLTR